MVRASSPAKLRPWSKLTAKMVMGVVPGLVLISEERTFKGLRRGKSFLLTVRSFLLKVGLCHKWLKKSINTEHILS